MKSMTRSFIPTIAAALIPVLAGCEGVLETETRPAQGPELSSVVDRGAHIYRHYCRACHGEEGDGKGPAAFALDPPPRDFTLAKFKFAAVPSGELPNDRDLKRVIRKGLSGTAMFSSKLSERDLAAVIQYLKTFSEDWTEFDPGEPIVAGPDPWRGRLDQATERGRKLYHGLAQCHSCHPAYVSRREIAEIHLEMRGQALSSFPDDLYETKLTDTAYGYRAVSPDLMSATMRSGSRARDFYRVVAAGIGGTGMPAMHGSLESDDIWALAHYVRWLRVYRSSARSNRAPRPTFSPNPSAFGS